MEASKLLLQPGDFTDMKAIGRGKDSVIYSARCAKLGGHVAVKVYQKARTSVSKLRAIKREAALMVYLVKKSVPSVTTFFGAFQDSHHICIVMEYCPQGDLLERLLAEGRAFTEARTAEVAASLLTTLQRMHALHIIHRDVKLENIFICANGELKLGDFGLCMSMKQESAISPVGTVEYMAPEVVALPKVDLVSSGKVDPATLMPCDTAVDIWALGITVYELLTGHLPFDGRDKAHIKRAITMGAMRPLPKSVSPEAADFVQAMLRPDPKLRATATELLHHPFLARSMCGSPRSVLPPVADATAYIQPETSPWPTKGGTACTEVHTQPKGAVAKLSIPESPEQLKGSGGASRPAHQLVSPVAFWNSDSRTPEAAADGSLVRAAHGCDELPTPTFPAVSPLGTPAPLTFGKPSQKAGFSAADTSGFGAARTAAAAEHASPDMFGRASAQGQLPTQQGAQHGMFPMSATASEAAFGSPDSDARCQQRWIAQQQLARGDGRSPGLALSQRARRAEQGPQQAQQQEAHSRTLSPSRLGAPGRLALHHSVQQHSKQPPTPPHPQWQPQLPPVKVVNVGDRPDVLAPYQPAACCDAGFSLCDASGKPVFTAADMMAPPDDDLMSWRHGQSHHDGLPWSPGRLLQRIGSYFSRAPQSTPVIAAR